MTPRQHSPQDWLSIAEYARAYNIDRRTVLKWIDHRLVTSWRVGRIIRIHNSPPITKVSSIDIR
jgi:excisionase family DNA binding protein